MKENKAPAPGGNRERAKTEEHRAGAISKSDFSMNEGKAQGVISGVLLHGKENAQTAAQIAGVLGLSDTRHVTTLVERERRQGGAICASTGRQAGYYLPANLNELEEYNRNLRRRVKSIVATLDAMQRAADAWSGQQRLDLGDVEAGDR